MRFVERADSFRNGDGWKLLEKHRPGATPQEQPAEEQKEAAVPEKVLVCRQCRRHITDERWRTSIAGKHRHTFANPHGHVYDIGCFASAVGCMGVGPPSNEFTWFKGYSWQVVICAGCMTHLGWIFLSSGEDFFYGLIIDRLVSSF